jgi:hypothetical protein
LDARWPASREGDDTGAGHRQRQPTRRLHESSKRNLDGLSGPCTAKAGDGRAERATAAAMHARAHLLPAVGLGAPKGGRARKAHRRACTRGPSARLFHDRSCEAVESTAKLAPQHCRVVAEALRTAQASHALPQHELSYVGDDHRGQGYHHVREPPVPGGVKVPNTNRCCATSTVTTSPLLAAGRRAR